MTNKKEIIERSIDKLAAARVLIDQASIDLERLALDLREAGKTGGIALGKVHAALDAISAGGGQLSRLQQKLVETLQPQLLHSFSRIETDVVSALINLGSNRATAEYAVSVAVALGTPQEFEPLFRKAMEAAK